MTAFRSQQGYGANIKGSGDRLLSQDFCLALEDCGLSSGNNLKAIIMASLL